MDGAGAALRDAAPVFGAYQIEVVSEYPKYGRAWIDINLVFFSVDI